MKKLYTYCTCLLLLGLINTTLAQNCEVPQVLYDYYDLDVKYLSIVRMEETNAAELLDSVFVPQLWQDTIWEGLAAVFNYESPERDLVFDAYCIHEYSSISKLGTTILVQIEPTTPWYDDWNNGSILTNTPYLDGLFETYGIDSVGNSLATLDIFTLYANEPLNYQAIVNLIEQDENINFAEGNGAAGDGDEIDYRLIDDIRYYDFTIGWGDCPSGCIFSHSWKFSVDANCNVTYLGESGSPDPPAPVDNCNISDIANNTSFLVEDLDVFVSPNPVSNQLDVSIPDLKNTSYTVYSLRGEIMDKGQSLNERFLLDFNEYPAGLYLLKLESDQGQATLKIIKQ